MPSQSADAFAAPYNNGGSTGLSSALIDDITASPTKYVILGAVTALYCLLSWFGSPKLDPMEPPVYKSTVPFFGHVFNLLTKGPSFYLDKKMSKVPIATLPMLHGKLYVAYDASIIQSILRKHTLGVKKFQDRFTQLLVGVDDKAYEPARTEGFLDKVHALNHEAMQPKHLYKMNVAALTFLGQELNSDRYNTPVKIPNLFYFFKQQFTLATARALWGPEHPFKGRQDLVDDFWIFEKNADKVMMNVPKPLVSKLWAARERVQVALREYYEAGGGVNPEASETMRINAGLLISHGCNLKDTADIEFSLLFVANANTIPTAFWAAALTFSYPAVLERIRAEGAAAIEWTPTPTADGRREAVLNVTKLQDACPYLVATYKETQRLTNCQLGTRAVTEDTIVSDDRGNNYLLKEGYDIMMPIEALHLDPSRWPEDPSKFMPERFYKPSSDRDRHLRQHFLPFGGGKHLCPGRNFAFAENVTYLFALAMGFELDNFKEPVCAPSRLTAAVKHPIDAGKGTSATMRRRKGWEDVVWRFTCS